MSTESKNLPSVWRRLGVILAYILVSSLVVLLAALLLTSHDCVQYADCTDQDKLVSSVASLLFWICFAFFNLAGWTGRLYGCRKS